MAQINSIAMGKLMKNVACEITLTGVKIFKIRMWVGIQVLKFAIWVIGMRGKVMVGNQMPGEGIY
jgi:hypothetical protein